MPAAACQTITSTGSIDWAGTAGRIRPASNRVSAGHQAPHALEYQGGNENREEHRPLAAADEAVTEPCLDKSQDRQDEPSGAINEAMRMPATPEVGQAPASASQRSQPVSSQASPDRNVPSNAEKRDHCDDIQRAANTTARKNPVNHPLQPSPRRRGGR